MSQSTVGSDNENLTKIYFSSSGNLVHTGYTPEEILALPVMEPDEARLPRRIRE